MSKAPVKFLKHRSMMLVGLLMSMGCVWKGGEPRSDFKQHAGDQVWKVVPVRMRVYPSTRFVESEGFSILEARVELFDAMGDSVKGVGKFRIEIFDRPRGGNPGVGQRRYSWEVSALTLADQHRYYDTITRSYLFRLKLEDQATAHRETVLQVIFISPEGNRLKTHSDLPIDLYQFQSLEDYK